MIDFKRLSMSKVKSAPKSRAQIQREYRARLKEKNYEQALKKERLRWHERVNKKRVKLVADLSARELRQKRKEWRAKKSETRRIQKILRSLQTHPQTPSISEDLPPFLERSQRGRKTLVNNRTKNARLVVKLFSQLEQATRIKDKYKHKFYRLQKFEAKKTQKSMSLSTPASLSSLSAHEPEPSTSELTTPSVGSALTPRSKTLEILSEIPNAPSHVRKTLLYHNVIVDEQQQSRANTTRQSRGGMLIKKYRLFNFAKKSGLPVSTQVNTPQKRAKRKDAVDDSTRQIIFEFYERDDNSRITTGKKQTVTRHKLKKQRRLLLDSMTNLHEKFCAEYVENIVSYTVFTRYRPFWVRMPTSKDRETCLCKKHDNIQLMADKLFQLKVLKSKFCEDYLQHVCCDVFDKSCMFRECETCNKQEIKFVEDGVPGNDTVVFWHQWTTSKHDYEKKGESKSTNITEKSVKKGTLNELKTQFSYKVSTELCRHVFIIRHQFRAYKSLKESLQQFEALLHIDFSENYGCKNASSIQTCHFGASNQQATLHTGVLYRYNGLTSFASVSASLRHDPPAIWAHIEPVLKTLHENYPEITTLHFFSDGPTTQYRNKKNFYLLSTQIYKLGYTDATWNFFESGHGKGAPDAIGGALKRRADDMVNMGYDIPTAQSLFKVMSESGSQIKLYYVDGANIEEMEKNCCKSLSAVLGTMKLHQLYTGTELTVSSRILSCFCTRPIQCSCYNIQMKKFPAMISEVSMILQIVLGGDRIVVTLLPEEHKILEKCRLVPLLGSLNLRSLGGGWK